MEPAFHRLTVGEGTVSSSYVAAKLLCGCKYAYFGSKEAVTGTLSYATPPEADAPLSSDVRGAIAVVRRGKCSFESKWRACAAAGAVGAILINAEDERFVAAPDDPTGVIPDPPANDIPFVVLSASDGEQLLSAEATSSFTMAPLPLDAGLPLYPFQRPLLPGDTRQVPVGPEEWRALEAHSAAGGKVVAVMCDKDAKLAETGTLASVELEGAGGDEGGMATLIAERPCAMQHLLRDNTRKMFGLAAVEASAGEASGDEASAGGGPVHEEADAAAAIASEMFTLLDCEIPDAPLSLRALSFALCGLISLGPRHEQAALEMSTAKRSESPSRRATPTPTHEARAPGSVTSYIHHTRLVLLTCVTWFDSLLRLEAVKDQLARNPPRGKELLEEAIGRKKRAPKKAAKRGSGGGGGGGGSGGGGGTQGSTRTRGGKPTMALKPVIGDLGQSVTQQAGEVETAVSSAAWSLRVSIGREKGTSMPEAWGQSGARLPFSVEVDMSEDSVDCGDGDVGMLGPDVCQIEPKVTDISITGFGGAVEIPIRGGGWTLRDGRLAFWLDFPEGSTRGEMTGDVSNVWGLAPGVATKGLDVELPAGRLFFEAPLVSDAELERLNRDFLALRSRTFEKRKAVKDIESRKNPAPVWSSEENAWVSKGVDEGPLAQAKQNADLKLAERAEKAADDKRPKRKDLSRQAGLWPGVSSESPVWVGSKGVVSMRRRGPFGIGSSFAVLGTWSMEPLMPIETFWTMPP